MSRGEGMVTDLKKCRSDMKNKRNYVVIVIFAMLLCTVAVVAAVTGVNNAAIRAIQKQDYEKLERVAKFPLVRPDGLIVNDAIDVLTDREQTGYPLELACEKDDLRAADILLSAGVDPNRRHCFRSGDNYSCLDIAVSRCNYEMAVLLLQYGAGTDNVQSGLINALFYRKAENLSFEDSVLPMYELLDGQGFFDGTDFDPVIQYSAMLCDMEATRFFLSIRHDDALWKDAEGNSLLHYCAKSGYADETAKIAYVSEVLLNGGQRDIRNKDGKTAYDYAAEYGDELLAEFLKSGEKRTKKEGKDSM